MANMPQEPEAFAEQVAFLLRRMQPEYAIDFVGPRELIVNGRRVDLENLFRMVAHEPGRGVEIVENYLDQRFTGEAFELADVAFDNARDRIMPRIQPESIFEHLSREMVAHVPFVNGSVIVFVMDLPHMTVSITTEQSVRWGVDFDELDDIARKNLSAYQSELRFQFVESKEGGRAAILNEQDGYDAARLLLPNLHRQMANELGGDFHVAIPARDMFVALSLGPDPFVDRLRKRVEHDYQRLPYPITDALYYVTRDGIAGGGIAEAA